MPGMKDQRARLFNLLHKESGRRNIRAARSNQSGRPTSWVNLHQYEPYSYREVLWSEVVFDVGDDTPWSMVREETNGLWELLTRHGVPFWGALSGGRGTHTHVFMRPAEHRHDFGKAMEALLDSKVGRKPDIDEGHLSPGMGSKLVREFGAQKKRRKTLWDFGRLGDLPPSREEAYRVAGENIPTRLEVARQPVGASHSVRAEALGGHCPRRLSCYDPDWGTCAACPTTR